MAPRQHAIVVALALAVTLAQPYHADAAAAAVSDGALGEPANTADVAPPRSGWTARSATDPLASLAVAADARARARGSALA